MNAITQLPVQHSISELQQMAVMVAQSKLFGIQTVEQAFVLMAIAQAEGRPAALAARDYHIIQNKPAKKSEAYMRDFIGAGGKVEWHELNDKVADATFSHAQGGTVRITWTIEMARAADLTKKDTWKHYPRRMLSARCIAEGVRIVCPVATDGMPTADELRDELPAEVDVTPVAPQLTEAPVTLDAVYAAYAEVTSVPEFQRARELAAKLPERDKTAAREYDRITLIRLKGGAQQTIIEQPERVSDDETPGQSPMQTPSAPAVSYAVLVERMRKTQDLEILEADASLIQALPIAQQAEVNAVYMQRRSELQP